MRWERQTPSLHPHVSHLEETQRLPAAPGWDQSGSAALAVSLRDGAGDVLRQRTHPAPPAWSLPLGQQTQAPTLTPLQDSSISLFLFSRSCCSVAWRFLFICLFCTLTVQSEAKSTDSHAKPPGAHSVSSLSLRTGPSGSAGPCTHTQPSSRARC